MNRRYVRNGVIFPDSISLFSNILNEKMSGRCHVMNLAKFEIFFIFPQMCSDVEVSDKENFPTFARTIPPITRISKSVAALLKKFNWTQVKQSIKIRIHRLHRKGSVFNGM